MNRKLLTAGVFGAYIATIPFANWWLDRFVFWDVPWLGAVASGVIWAGLALCLRDIAQLLTNKWATIPAILVGAAISYQIADPNIAKASAVAFLLSELLDWAIYTPLARRRFVAAVAASSVAGGALDSAVFLRIAFDSVAGWWQLAVAKAVIVALFLPVAWWSRRAVARHLPASA